MKGNMWPSVPALPRPLLRGLWPLGVLVLTAAAAAVMVWVGCRAQAEALVADREAAYQAAKQQQALLQTRRRQQEIAKAAQRAAAAQWRHLPTQQEFATLAMSISQWGQAERVLIPSMTFQMQQRETGLPSQASMLFKVSGEYADLYRFMRRLEQAETYLVIESLDAGRADQAARSSGARVVCNVKVTTYLRGDDGSTEPS